MTVGTRVGTTAGVTGGAMAGTTAGTMAGVAADMAAGTAAAPAAHAGLETPVPSPCINICRMEAEGGLCEGCLRTLDEIAAWSQLPNAARRRIWAALEGRRAARVAQPGAESQVSPALPASPAPAPAPASPSSSAASPAATPAASSEQAP